MFLFDKKTKELLSACLLQGGKGDLGAKQVIYVYDNNALIGMRTVSSYKSQRSPNREEYIIRNGQVIIRNSYGSAKENMDGYLKMADSIRIVGILP